MDFYLKFVFFFSSYPTRYLLDICRVSHRSVEYLKGICRVSHRSVGNLKGIWSVSHRSVGNLKGICRLSHRSVGNLHTGKRNFMQNVASNYTTKIHPMLDESVAVDWYCGIPCELVVNRWLVLWKNWRENPKKKKVIKLHTLQLRWLEIERKTNSKTQKKTHTHTHTHTHTSLPVRFCQKLCGQRSK